MPWQITLEAVGEGQPPEEIRVRRLLKAALRTYDLRCIDQRFVQGKNHEEDRETDSSAGKAVD